MANKFLAHRKQDSVGVATDAISAGETVEGMVLEDGSKTSVKVLEDIPYGHKIALTDLAEGATVVEYGHPIGRAVASIQSGEYVHVHNIKSNRL